MTSEGAGGVRLQKFLAEGGVASRRKAEELIVAGRVKVNERRVKELGTKVDPDRDLVTVDGRLVSRRETKSYYLLYKPTGCVTTASDPEGRPTALEYLRDVKERVFPVGRLDYDAEGAVLFTDDGELANRLAHPRYGHQRTYLVKVRGEPPATALERMVAGVRLEDGPARALEAVPHERTERNFWIRVVVAEGRFHLVKRLCEAVGLFVQRLYRPEFGGVTVEGLLPGQFRPLTPVEVRAMKALVGIGGGAPASQPPRELPRAARRHGHGPPAPPEPVRGARAGRGARRRRARGGAARDRGRRSGAARRGRRRGQERGRPERERGRAGRAGAPPVTGAFRRRATGARSASPAAARGASRSAACRRRVPAKSDGTAEARARDAAPPACSAARARRGGEHAAAGAARGAERLGGWRCAAACTAARPDGACPAMPARRALVLAAALGALACRRADLHAAEPERRAAAVRALGARGDLAVLLVAERDPSALVRRAVAEAFAARGGPDPRRRSARSSSIPNRTSRSRRRTACPRWRSRRRRRRHRRARGSVRAYGAASPAVRAAIADALDVLGVSLREAVEAEARASGSATSRCSPATRAGRAPGPRRRSARARAKPR